MVFLLVPMFLALIQSRKHDWQDCGRVITNQTKDVLVIPEIQSSLSHLQVKLHKKKKNRKKPKKEHLRNQSTSKQSYKRNTRQKNFWLVQQLVKETKLQNFVWLLAI